MTGLAGAGKSTFSRAMAERTGLPLILLDLQYWRPGWQQPSDDEWIAQQRDLTAKDQWILDGNYRETLELRLERADTAIYLHTPWWLCSWRAFRRGLRRPVGTKMPDGCEDSTWRRVRDEWWLVFRIWRVRRSEPAHELDVLHRHADRVAVHVLRSKREVRQFLQGLDVTPLR